ncbi:hypothetical protein HGRIS_006279 [Hohenbuehelia grisea]|uniref:GSKIP domain-containing protein n=1 Tax=Hohenbuehelia grisea TaxID=104357 RepID=A0ABR3JZV3_9AGAR
MSHSQVSSFFGTELQRALREQAFGITSFELVDAGPLQAGAKVTLLEGSAVTVTLTGRGYHWDAHQSQRPSVSASSSSGQVYEGIEDLLTAISPLYQQRFQETLFSKLAKLQ